MWMGLRGTFRGSQHGAFVSGIGKGEVGLECNLARCVAPRMRRSGPHLFWRCSTA